MEQYEHRHSRDSSIYTPLLVVSLLSLIVTLPAGAFLTIAAMFHGGGDNYGDGSAVLSGTGYVIGLAVMSVIWIVVVLAILTARRDGVSRRAKTRGVIVSAVSFWGVLFATLALSTAGLGHVDLSLLVGAPVLGALAGSYAIGSGWVR